MNKNQLTILTSDFQFRLPRPTWTGIDTIQIMVMVSVAHGLLGVVTMSVLPQAD